MVLGARHCLVLLFGVLYCALLHDIRNLCPTLQLSQSIIRMVIRVTYSCLGIFAVQGIAVVARTPVAHGGLL